MTPCYYCDDGGWTKPPEVKTLNCKACIHHPEGPKTNEVLEWKKVYGALVSLAERKEEKRP
jgi:hypothetical protein